MAYYILSLILGIVFSCFIMVAAVGSVWLMFEEDKRKHEEN